jgi:hypothetical protein
MRKIIHNLRKQPEEVRTHILHVLTIGAAIVMVTLWVYSLGRNLTSTETQVKLEEDIQPFSALKANLIGGYNSITEPSPQSDQPPAEDSLMLE